MNFFFFNAYKNALFLLMHVFNNVFITIKSKTDNENEDNN